jgi:hypothetical protein
MLHDILHGMVYCMIHCTFHGIFHCMIHDMLHGMVYCKIHSMVHCMIHCMIHSMSYAPRCDSLHAYYSEIANVKTATLAYPAALPPSGRTAA